MKIGRIVKQELREELSSTTSQEEIARIEIADIDSKIQESLQNKGLPNDIFNRAFDLQDATNSALSENAHYDRKAALGDSIKLSRGRLQEIYVDILSRIDQSVNQRLKAFNRVVYGRNRASSELHLHSSNSYRFNSPTDTGTGKSYAGLIGFDLAMLSLTGLPLVAHDSIIYKNIEVPAMKRILRIFSSVKTKQIFITFDEAKKFGHVTEERLKRCMVLKLGHGSLLYTKDWRDFT